jgi:hypothetical protein
MPQNRRYYIQLTVGKGLVSKVYKECLKQLRPIGKGEQVLEKRLDQKALT